MTAQEEGLAVAWALVHMRGMDTPEWWRDQTRGMSRTRLVRIKRRMWQHIEANRMTAPGAKEER